jgi:hypothetical protein
MANHIFMMCEVEDIIFMVSIIVCKTWVHIMHIHIRQAFSGHTAYFVTDLSTDL